MKQEAQAREIELKVVSAELQTARAKLLSAEASVAAPPKEDFLWLSFLFLHFSDFFGSSAWISQLGVWNCQFGTWTCLLCTRNCQMGAWNCQLGVWILHLGERHSFKHCSIIFC